MLEFLAPAGEQLFTLHLGERVVLEQVALLAVVARPRQAQTGRVAEKPPRLRTPTVRRPQLHHDVAAAVPSGAQLLRAVEYGAATTGAEPQLLELAVGQAAAIDVVSLAARAHQTGPPG